jgi:hypothetical protein
MKHQVHLGQRFLHAMNAGSELSIRLRARVDRVTFPFPFHGTDANVR